MDETKALAESIAKALVLDPDGLTVEATRDDMGVLLTIRPNQENGDGGKIVGRGGKTIKAIRTVIFAKGYMHDIRASVKIDIPKVD